MPGFFSPIACPARPDMSPLLLPYWLTAALLLAYAFMCLAIWRGHKRKQTAAARALQAAHLTASATGAALTGVSTSAPTNASTGAPADPASGAAPAASAAETAPPILIAWATQTGMARGLAEDTAARLQAAGQPAQALPLSALNAPSLQQARRLLVIASTYGEGEPPDEAIAFEKQLMRANLELPQLEYAVLALGDISYENYCQFGQAIDGWLAASKARRLFPCVMLNSMDEDDTLAAQAEWNAQIARSLGLPPGALKTAPAKTPPAPEADWQDWRIARNTQLNPGSAGAPVHYLELTAPACLPLSADAPWQAGDLAQIAPPADPAHPREYSIASTPAQGSLHLLVRRLQKDDGSVGVCSGWLTRAAPGQTLRLRLRPNQAFRLGPNAARPLILIGNGVGLAGLLSHLHQRERLGQRRNWLIFGERNAAHDWHCRDLIARWQSSGHLTRVDTAFSRDGASGQPKTYVQDIVAQQADTLRQWVNEENAAIYVCGSLAGMASGVDAALRQILGDAAIDTMLSEKRYCRDVF